MRDARRILVLGSNSFTGGHFIDFLLSHTDCQVLAVSRSPQYSPLFLPFRYRQPDPGPERYRFVQLDVNTRLAELGDLCQEFLPEGVVNFAAQGEVRTSWNHPEHWYRTNCQAVVAVAELLRSQSQLQCYVAASTPEVYGSTGERVAENECYRPSTPYAISKLAGDLHLLALHRRYGFPVVLTRSANLYGIHQQLYRIIPRAALYMKSGRRVQLHGRGASQRAFIHAQDVARGTWLALQRGRLGEVYHLAPVEGTRSIASVVETICARLGRSFADSVDLVEENYGQDPVFSLDASKAADELGWKCEVPFEEGVRETLAWIEENFEALAATPLDYVHQE